MIFCHSFSQCFSLRFADLSPAPFSRFSIRTRRCGREYLPLPSRLTICSPAAISGSLGVIKMKVRAIGTKSFAQWRTNLCLSPYRFPATKGEDRGDRGRGASWLGGCPVGVAALRGPLGVGELGEVAGDGGGAALARPLCPAALPGAGRAHVRGVVGRAIPTSAGPRDDARLRQPSLAPLAAPLRDGGAKPRRTRISTWRSTLSPRRPAAQRNPCAEGLRH
jgi:hypothetical protein